VREFVQVSLANYYDLFDNDEEIFDVKFGSHPRLVPLNLNDVDILGKELVLSNETESYGYPFNMTTDKEFQDWLINK